MPGLASSAIGKGDLGRRLAQRQDRRPRCRPTNDETFRTCVEEVPASAPELGDIAVMDNAGRRKSDAVRRAIEDRGAEPRFSQS